MDCHRCKNIRYDGNPYGRCALPGHQDVVLRRRGRDEAGTQRPYNRQVCPDFVMRRRCSNCAYWSRGEYFRDGKTPSRKGKCSLRIVERDGHDCPLWKRGQTRWKKRPRAERACAT